MDGVVVAGMETLFRRPDRIDAKLNVCTVLFNSVRYRARWKLTEDFIRQVERHHNARVCVAEVAFGEREFVIASATDPYHLRLRTCHELFFKENALNLLFARVMAADPEAEYFAWVDADTHLARYDWVDEAIHQLQHHPVVQLWSEMQDLTDEHEVLATGPSFVQTWQEGRKGEPGCHGAPGRQHLGPTGLGWAAIRAWIEGVGGLLDVCVVGSCDWWMGYALIGRLEAALAATGNHPGRKGRGTYHPDYVKAICEWERRTRLTQWKERPLQGNIGLVKGLALHYFHGPKADRRYQDREQIFIRHQFNPLTDLKRDVQGLWQLTADKPEMRRDLQRYYRGRNEDAPTR